jgi:hypothetical protein
MFFPISIENLHKIKVFVDREITVVLDLNGHAWVHITGIYARLWSSKNSFTLAYYCKKTFSAFIIIKN